MSQTHECKHPHPTGTHTIHTKAPILILACGKNLFFPCSNIFINPANQRLRGTPGSPRSPSAKGFPRKQNSSTARGRAGAGSALSAEMEVVRSESEDEAGRSAARTSGRGPALGTVGARGPGRAGRRPHRLRARPLSASAHARRCRGAVGSSPSAGPVCPELASASPVPFSSGFEGVKPMLRVLAVRAV